MARPDNPPGSDPPAWLGQTRDRGQTHRHGSNRHGTREGKAVGRKAVEGKALGGKPQVPLPERKLGPAPQRRAQLMWGGAQGPSVCLGGRPGGTGEPCGLLATIADRGWRAHKLMVQNRADARLRRVAPPAQAGARSRASSTAAKSRSRSRSRERDLRAALTDQGGLQRRARRRRRGRKTHSSVLKDYQQDAVRGHDHARRPAGSAPRPADPRRPCR